MTGYQLMLLVLCLCTGGVYSQNVDMSGELSLEKRVRLLETIMEQQYVTNQKLLDRVEELERTVNGQQETTLRMRGNSSRDVEGRTDADLEAINGTLGNITVEDDYLVDMECPAVCLRQKLHKKEGNQDYRLADNRIAFHAYQSSNRCYANREIIRYDKETMDFGGGYTPYDGIFDAPTSGVYVFSWTIATSVQTGWFVAQLIVDGEVKGVIASDSDSAANVRGGIHPATGVVSTYVEAGQHVFIKMMQVTGTCGTVKSDILVRSTFSGWLLF